MLIRYFKLYKDIDTYLGIKKLDQLRLNSIEIRQVEYIIELTRLFTLYTSLIGQTKGPTIQYVFSFYNKIFSLLEDTYNKLRVKRDLQKQYLLKAIRDAQAKLRKYYLATVGSLRHLYSYAILLTPLIKERFQKTKYQRGTVFSKTYQRSLRKLYDEVYVKQSST